MLLLVRLGWCSISVWVIILLGVIGLRLMMMVLVCRWFRLSRLFMRLVSCLVEVFIEVSSLLWLFLDRDVLSCRVVIVVLIVVRGVCSLWCSCDM